MTNDPNDKAFADLSHWPLDAIPDNDSGSIEVRRRALEDALVAFNGYWYSSDDAVDVAGQLEALEVAIDEKREREGIPPPDDGDDDLEGDQS